MRKHLPLPRSPLAEKFQVLFLNGAKIFLDNLDPKAREKILFNIRKAQVVNDPELFKKLNMDIWEFRTLYNKKHYRLFAFWDKTEKEDTLIVCTHGHIKKTGKTPDKDISRAVILRSQYFVQKKEI